MKPLNLIATTDYRYLKGGKSQPRLVSTIEKGTGREVEVVLKLKKPVGCGHYGSTSLSCELICAAIAKKIGLNVPDYAIVHLTDDFVENIDVEQDGNKEAQVKYQKLKDRYRRNLGENFGTVFSASAESWEKREGVNGELRDQLCSIVSFDAAILNWDRNHEKPNLLLDGAMFYLIDHSLALCPKLISDEDELKRLLPKLVPSHVAKPYLRKKNLNFNGVYDEWNAAIDHNFLDEIRNWIPESWEEDKGDLDVIFSFLSDRNKQFPHLLLEIIRGING